MRRAALLGTIAILGCGSGGEGATESDAGSDATSENPGQQGSQDAAGDASAASDAVSDSHASDVTGVDVVHTDGAPTGQAIKWHPGHYGLTYGPILKYGAAINSSEIASLSGKSAIAGYKAYIYWAAVDLGPVTFAASVAGASSGTLTSTTTKGGGGAGQTLTDGTYWFAFSDGSYRKVTLAGSACSWSSALAQSATTTAYVYQFGQIDQQIAQLQTKLDKPRQYALSVLPGSFTSSGLGSDVMPNYVITDPAMGPSPVSGSYGWWGGKGNGNTAAAATHRSAVNARWIALVRALGAYYDDEPSFEALAVQEDSWAEGALSTNGCPDYSNSAYVASLKTFLSAAVAAFPHTNVVEQNSWVGVATDAQELADWMTQNRIAPANADTWGQSYITSKGIAASLPWGVAAYAGVVVPGSNWSPAYDMRPLIRYMPDVEAPDLGLFANISGGPFTPADLVAALNQTLQASHVFWTIIPDGTAGVAAPNDKGQAWWSNLCTFLASNPLTHTAYPPKYP